MASSPIASSGSSTSLAVETAFLADFVKVDASGLWNVIGGGLDRIVAESLPRPVSLFLFLQLRKDTKEAVASSLEVRVSRPSGEPAISLDGEFSFGVPDTRTNLALGLSLIVDVEGIWEVAIKFPDVGTSWRTDLHVILNSMD